MNSYQNLKSLKWALSVLVLVLGACSSHEDTTTTSKVTDPLAKPASGGTDSGGGNGIQGQPLESFSKPVSSLPEFKRVQVVIDNLSKNCPEVAADFVHIVKERTWYFVPIELDTIPSTRLGVSFATDQFGLQNRREVWVSLNNFNNPKSTEDSRSELILHELGMGMRLMSYASDYDKCLDEAAIHLANEAGLGDVKNKQAYDVAKDICLKNAEIAGLGVGGDGSGLNDDRIDLHDSDYDNVRELTVRLKESQGHEDCDSLKLWLKVRKLRVYPEPPTKPSVLKPVNIQTPNGL